jgi:hypothetical protein
MDKNYPLIIVFYIDAETMKIQEIVQPFVESVNDMLFKKEANALAFFLPTTGEERVECINPMIVKEADMEKINQMIEDIKTKFSIGTEMNVSEEDIIPPSQCDCGDGTCNCGKHE